MIRFGFTICSMTAWGNGAPQYIDISRGCDESVSCSDRHSRFLHGAAGGWPRCWLLRLSLQPNKADSRHSRVRIDSGWPKGVRSRPRALPLHLRSVQRRRLANGRRVHATNSSEHRRRSSRRIGKGRSSPTASRLQNRSCQRPVSLGHVSWVRHTECVLIIGHSTATTQKKSCF